MVPIPPATTKIVFPFLFIFPHECKARSLIIAGPSLISNPFGLKIHVLFDTAPFCQPPMIKMQFSSNCTRQWPDIVNGNSGPETVLPTLHKKLLSLSQFDQEDPRLFIFDNFLCSHGQELYNSTDKSWQHCPGRGTLSFKVKNSEVLWAKSPSSPPTIQRVDPWSVFPTLKMNFNADTWKKINWV